MHFQTFRIGVHTHWDEGTMLLPASIACQLLACACMTVSMVAE